jgi:hypothetical protein
LGHDHLPIERTSRQRSERVREPATSNGQDEGATKRDRELGLRRGNSGQKVEPALAHGPSAANAINLMPNTRRRQSKQAESGLGGAEASMRTGQGHSDVRSQTPANRIATDAPPVRSGGGQRDGEKRAVGWGSTTERQGRRQRQPRSRQIRLTLHRPQLARKRNGQSCVRVLARLRSDLELKTELEQSGRAGRKQQGDGG